MRNRLLATDGLGEFVETIWRKPKHKANEIHVKAVMTGICRSDIDMMQGKFGPLPIHMQGHEGLAQVIEVGKNIDWVEPGDYVATRGEPAFSDRYNVRAGEFVKVPEAHPKYIVEPVACALNIVEQALPMLMRLQGANSRLLILGSGFLAWIVWQTLVRKYNLTYHIHVVGKSNKKLWRDACTLDSQPLHKYDVIVDLKDDLQVLENALLKPGALWVVAAEKKQKLTTNFSQLLWNANSIICPSPRAKSFENSMRCAVDWIEDGTLNVDSFWTKGYNRNTEWQQAFADGLNRPEGYSRGYLIWD